MVSITDIIMCIITFVYALATICIMIFDYMNMRATKAQVDEMRKQYDELYEPFIEVELNIQQRTMYELKFVNRGLRNAEHVKIVFDSDFLESIADYESAKILFRQKGKECIIGAGQSYSYYLFSLKDKKEQSLRPVSGTVTYENRGKKYNQTFYIDLNNYLPLFTYETDEEIIEKLLLKHDEMMKNIVGILSSK